MNLFIRVQVSLLVIIFFLCLSVLWTDCLLFFCLFLLIIVLTASAHRHCPFLRLLTDTVLFFGIKELPKGYYLKVIT